jgi:molybdate transport system substrate-binding protein
MPRTNTRLAAQPGFALCVTGGIKRAAMTFARFLALALLLVATPLRAGQIQVAAAADLRFAMDEIVSLFEKSHPDDRIEVSYGSSGKFYAQIRNGAPFDLFFSADSELPEKLVQEGLAVPDVKPYALGRIVLWRPGSATRPLTLADLPRPENRRIAIANPKHAPYGMRAVEALKAAQVWDAVEKRLVFGENIAQTAQFVQTGNADIGIIALSLALAPAFAGAGSYTLIPADMHQPLRQGFVILKRGEGKELARDFANFFSTAEVRQIMSRYGFSLPDTPTAR